MARVTWMIVGLLVSVGAATAAPRIDCTGPGALLEAEAGWISLDDELVFLAAPAAVSPRIEGPSWEDIDLAKGRGPEVEGTLPEDFCSGHEGLVAFILPVPKVLREGPDEPPDGASPPPTSVQDGHDVGFGPSRGGYSMTPEGKPASPASDEAEAPAPPALAVEAEEVDADPEADLASAEEPAPSPSRGVEADGVVLRGAGCGIDPSSGGGASWLLLGLLGLVRRLRGAR